MRIKIITVREVDSRDFEAYCRFLQTVGWSWRQVHELRTYGKSSKIDNDPSGVVFTTIERVG